MSNEIDTSPIINVVSRMEYSRTTPGYTGFYVRVCPRGMDAVLTVDPKARFIERFSHHYGINSTLMYSGIKGWTEQLNTASGFEMFYDYCARNAKYESSLILQGVTEGFMFEVSCPTDSPLVGWFLVLGVQNG